MMKTVVESSTSAEWENRRNELIAYKVIYNM